MDERPQNQQSEEWTVLVYRDSVPTRYWPPGMPSRVNAVALAETFTKAFPNCSIALAQTVEKREWYAQLQPSLWD